MVNICEDFNSDLLSAKVYNILKVTLGNNENIEIGDF